MAVSSAHLRPVDSRSFEFGDFRLEPATRQLLRGSAAIPLAPRTFDLLLTLVENRHRVLEKDELLRRVWSDAIVEESNLSQQVFVLRRALGDAQETPRFIATVPRRGYRFVGDVREVASTRPAAMVAAVVAPPAAPKRQVWLTATGVVLVATSLIPAGRIATRALSRPSAAAPPTFHRLTYRGGGIDRARFTADGRSVVIAARWQGDVNQLFITPVNESAVRPLGIDRARVVRVAPTGDAAVLLDGDAPGKVALARVPLAGGGPRVLVDDVQAADWAPEIDRFAIVRRAAGRARVEYPAGTALYEAAGWIDAIKISPDRDSVAFLEHPVMNDTRGALRVVDRQGRTRVASPESAAAFGAAWTPKGDEVWFGTSDGRISTISAIDMSGRQRDVYRGPNGLILQDMVSDGRVLVTQFNLESGIAWRPREARDRDLSMFSVTRASALADDGRTLLFTVEDQGAAFPSYATYLETTNSSGPVLLGEGSAQGLSPDGRWALSIVLSKTPHLVLIPTSAGVNRAIPAGPVEQIHQAQWLPDGQRIVFAGNEKGKGIRVYVQSAFSGSPASAITPEGYSIDPQGVSTDGRFVLCFAENRPPSRCSIDGGAIEPLAGVTAADKPVRWDANGRVLYVFRRGASPMRIFAVDTRTGERTLWKELPASARGSIPPGGRTAAVRHARCRVVRDQSRTRDERSISRRRAALTSSSPRRSSPASADAAGSSTG